MTEADSILIIGAGQSGAVAAATLRDLGHAGPITLIGREAHAPYERPPLSKAVLQSAEAHAQTAVHPGDFYEQRRITLLTGAEALRLDPSAHLVHLSDGRRLEYSRCLLATGGRARELPSLPRGTAGVHYIRTLDDAAALRAGLTPQARVVVIGGGFLGLEVASTARSLGADVTVLESAPRLLERVLPAALSDWLADRVRHAGVTLRLDARIARSRAQPHPDAAVRHHARFTLELQDATVIEADVVVVAIGLAPEVSLAEQAGLALDAVNGGIVVDANCRSSDAAIYAAGDCASQHRRYLNTALRLESWQNANEQARAAAAGMLGLPTPGEPYPWFWTDQFGCNVQMLGLPQPGLAYTCRGVPLSQADAPKFIWLGHRDGIPVHAIAINAGGDLRQLRVLFEQGLRIDPQRYADETVALKPLVKACQQSAAAAS
ncbi:NAD(P)/FAD-dependent oxidoreductase [Achromobacter piechaudii]|uniref:Anthranilate 1,2-dioxygenase system ferredoxin--NAD(+) reductase component n=1 Tax=Achromobacter piechaudii TaxID=72556 RepID=A0A6S7EWZ4_9BURK|nr:FAD-dependent oxidoreductase [Achromobacter piechaudii]CAB3918984.1 Anthranilate 1,2-dioxygenase system ferredoxin--NAD(+) reductase component [Achromobacter piechaudii]